MAEPTAISVILEPLALIFSGLRSLPWSRLLSLSAAAVAFPFRLLLVALGFLTSVLFVILSPALYILIYLYSWAAAVLAFLASLEVRNSSM